MLSYATRVPMLSGEANQPGVAAHPLPKAAYQIQRPAQHIFHLLNMSSASKILTKARLANSFSPGDSHQTARLNYNLPPPLPSFLHNVHHQFNQAGC